MLASCLYRCALLLLLVCPLSVQAAKLAEFDASYLNLSGLPFDPQTDWGWSSRFLDEQGNLNSGVVQDGNTGRNAWQVSANSQSSLNPFFVYAPAPPVLDEIAQTGSRLSATIRLVEPSGGQGGAGVGTYMNDRSYLVRFDLDSTGALLATLDGDPTSPHQLTPSGQGTADYHGVQLRFAPDGGLSAELWFDGQPVVQNWDGTPIVHPATVQWGVAPLTQGVMNYSYVLYESGPFKTNPSADFNRDGVVDLADYTRWRDKLGRPVTPFSFFDPSGNGLVDADDYSIWKSSTGQPSASLPSANLPASRTAVPEPSTLALALAGLAGWALRRTHRAKKQV